MDGPSGLGTEAAGADVAERRFPQLKRSRNVGHGLHANSGPSDNNGAIVKDAAKTGLLNINSAIEGPP
jgi:hypothetical protein